MTNTSVSLDIEEKKKIDDCIKRFENKTGFKLSVAEFVKVSIREKIKKMDKEKSVRVEND